MTGTLVEPRLEHSFQELYEMEGATVLAYLRAATGDPADAEDLAADTFLRAWKQWPQFRDTGAPPRHWLLRIARNLVIDRARRRARIRFTELGDEAGTTQDVAQIDRLQLLAAVAHLPPDDREIVALRAAGLTFAEVGAEVGKTEGAAKMAWRRAAERLREHLER